MSTTTLDILGAPTIPDKRFLLASSNFLIMLSLSSLLAPWNTKIVGFDAMSFGLLRCRGQVSESPRTYSVSFFLSFFLKRVVG